MVDDRVGFPRNDAAVALVARLGAVRTGLLATLLAIRRRRLAQLVRRLDQALQFQHQLDQFVLTQMPEITAAHDARESARRHGKRTLGLATPATAARGHPASWITISKFPILYFPKYFSRS